MKTEKKIRILQGIRQGKIGGGESYLLGLVENLDRSRFEPVVLSFTEGPMVDKLRKSGIATHVIHTEKPFDIRVWSKVAGLIKKERIDLVHAHGTRAMSNMYRPALQQHLPLLYTCHGWSFHRDQNPFVKKLRVLSEQYLTSKATVNICGAKANRNEARHLFGRFRAKIIYNSIDHEKFNPYGTYKNLRADLGIADNEIVVASVARFTIQKQPLKLIAAFAEVCRELENITLLMVGDGEDKQPAVDLVKKLGIENRVIMQPFRQDVPDVLAAADIFVLPSLWEVFPIALLEAMSMGKAVIATNVGGTPEMVTHDGNGVLIDVDNLKAELTLQLRRVCEDQSFRQHLSANAIATIYNQYGLDVMARKNEAVYEKLAGVKEPLFETQKLQ
jgi:glycosyltransferase involved in cell wall biosynthesis